MAQNQNNRISKGVCEKIYNAVSGGRKIRFLPHHIQGSSSSETAKKSRDQNSDNPTQASPPKKPVFQNHSSHRMIPIEFEPSIRPFSMSQKPNLQTTANNNVGKGDGTNGQVEKVPSTKDKPPSRASMEGIMKLKGRMASMAKTKSTKENAIQEKGDEVSKTEYKKANDEFSDYIGHVKNKMGIVSNAGDAGVERTVTRTRRDSFNDKVSSYIKSTRMKIRTTTNFDGKSSTFK